MGRREVWKRGAAGREEAAEEASGWFETGHEAAGCTSARRRSRHTRRWEGKAERGVSGIRARDGARAAGKRRLRSRPSRWVLSVAATSQPAARPALLNTTEPLWTLSTRKVSVTEPPSWAEMYKRTPRREDWSASGRCRSYKRPSPLFSPRPLLKVLQRSSPPPSPSRPRPPHRSYRPRHHSKKNHLKCCENTNCAQDEHWPHSVRSLLDDCLWGEQPCRCLDCLPRDQYVQGVEFPLVGRPG